MINEVPSQAAGAEGQAVALPVTKAAVLRAGVPVWPDAGTGEVLRVWLVMLATVAPAAAEVEHLVAAEGELVGASGREVIGVIEG